MTKTIRFVRELRSLNSNRANQCLVTDGARFWCVSSAHAPVTGFETLVFESDSTGRITDWCEVAGGRGMSRNQAIEELMTKINSKD